MTNTASLGSAATICVRRLFVVESLSFCIKYGDRTAALPDDRSQ